MNMQIKPTLAAKGQEAPGQVITPSQGSSESSLITTGAGRKENKIWMIRLQNINSCCKSEAAWLS